MDEEYGIELVEPFTEIPFEELTSTQLKYAQAAKKGFYSARAARTKTITRQAPYKTGNRAGEARDPIEITHIWINGSTKKSAWFVVHFANGKFASAEVWDAFGVERTLKANYAVGALAQKRQSWESDKGNQARVKEMLAEATRSDKTYNDGETYTLRHRVIESVTEFEQWLVRYDQTFAPRKAAT